MDTIQETLIKLDKINGALDKTYETSLNLNKVFNANALRVTGDKEIVELDKQVLLKNIWKDGCTVTWGKWSKAGSKFVEHFHEESIEYLICIKGSFSISFGKHIRVLSPGDCVSLPKEAIHSVLALADDSEMMAICVPAEKAYMTLGLK